MKKIHHTLCILTALLLTAALCGCGAASAPAAETPAPVEATPTETQPAMTAVLPDAALQKAESAEPAGSAPADEAPNMLKLRAEQFKDKSVQELFAVVGEPESSSYAPSCLGSGEDGELCYDGFTVYTYREGEREIVTGVE